MRVLAFAMDEERLRIIEHHRRFYAEQFSTPVYELLMELIVQANYLYEQVNEHNRFQMEAYQKRYVAELQLALDHVSIMHEQVSASWQKLQAFDWNVSYGMSLEEATERMTR
jgi:hypothetical protein